MKALIIMFVLVLPYGHSEETSQAVKPPTMPPSSSVVELNVWTFPGSVGDGRLWFVQFYVPWCRGCKRMVGQFDELAESFMANPDLVVARFDCMQNEDLCERLGVDRTPTLKLFVNGSAVETYKADFYHVGLMVPFLHKMLDKYKGQQQQQQQQQQQLSQDRDSGASSGGEDVQREGPAGATSSVTATRVQAGAYEKPDTESTPAAFLDDKMIGVDGSPAADEEGRASGPSGAAPQGTTVGGQQSTPGVQSGGLKIPSKEGEVGGRVPPVPGDGTRTGTIADAGDARPVVTAAAQAAEETCGDGSSGSEPLTRRGRHGGLSMETLGREKEEL